MAKDINNFEDLNLNKQLLTAVADLGYSEPTPIQKKAIPIVVAGQDMMGIAQTGTGKTAAYILPLLMRIKYAQGQNPKALILAPTRELALQIDKAIQGLAVNTDVRHTAIYGGLGPKIQIETIKKGIDILVATPGRFMEIYRAGELIVKEIKTLVIDEADKMMDMGFMPQVKKILEIMPQKKQNILFSATMPEKVVKLSEEFLKFPQIIEIAPQSTPTDTINQVSYSVPNFKTKINLLEYLLNTSEFNRVIVFVKTKESANNIYKYLSRKMEDEIRVIHANKGQNSRINAMNEFKEGNVKVLVATDVAARGIDVSLVSHVINFDVPFIYEDYVHRIGRTGRANNKGEAITFVTKSDEYHIEKIQKLIRQTIQVLPIPENIIIEDTSFEEKQDMARQVDDQKKKEDPNFKGSFHEKKKSNMKKEVKKYRKK